MKKRWVLLLFAGCLLLAAVAVMRPRPVEDQLVPMVMVDGKRYALYDFQQEPPEGDPDGEIRKIVGNQLPTENEQANFGHAGMPYWKTRDGICVFVNVNYLLFEVQE